MAAVCRESPVPIALDEELVGKRSDEDKCSMLEEIRPQYIILKPALCGGLSEASAWVDIAARHRIGWWATSALESNIGLDSIARWCFSHNVSMPQGLGTGQLYSNNFASPLELRGDKMFCNPDKNWAIPHLPWRR